MNNLSLIIGREYTTRVKKKGFIITTLVMPLFFVALMILPTLISEMNNKPQTITVVDKSGQLMMPLMTSGLPLAFPSEPVDSVLANEDYSSILVIGENVVSDPSDIALYNRGAENLQTRMILIESLKNIIEDIRLKEMGQDNVREILAQVEADVDISTYSLGDNGDTESSDAMVSFLVGMVMTFILYMFILMYGQMVMTSIIEEKNNRVLEILVTSVKPTHLMLGKLVGIGLVAVTQVVIWCGIIAGIVGWVLPAIASPEIMESMANISMLSEVFRIFGYLVVFLIGGFLLYASLYAAIGASVDNIQDASQLQTFAVIPVLIALMFSMSVAQNPNSEIATILSLIPLTSPMVMMARIPAAGVPMWEIIASIVILYISIYFVIWITAKIYRVGIFMYGKKPTIKELIRWARYK